MRRAIDKQNREHVPDRTAIWDSLVRLDWQLCDPCAVQPSDGEVWLALVAVCNRDQSTWSYECNVIRFSCDEGHFGIATIDGEPWGWSLDEVDWYVVVHQ